MAAPVPFSFLYGLIRMHAKRVPQPAMDTAILQAARQFCLQSRYRQQSLSVDIVGDQFWYPLTAPNTDEEVIRIEAVQFNGEQYPVPLWPIGQWETYEEYPRQYPRRFFYEPPNNLVVLPIPTTTLLNGLSVRVVLQPTPSATTLDYTLVQQYDRTIAQGALKFLLETNDSPWTNPKMAESFEEEFMAGIASAKCARESDFRPRNLLTAVHRF